MKHIVCLPESQELVRPTKSACDLSVWDFIWVLLLAIGGAMNPSFVKAQTSYGSVVGTVTDSAGALLQGRSTFDEQTNQRRADGGD